MSEWVAAVRQHRFVYLTLADALCWGAAFVVFAFARFMLNGITFAQAVVDTPWTGALLMAAVAAGLHVLLGFGVRLHQGRSIVGSLEEILALGLVGGLAGLATLTLNLLLARPVPGSVPLAATCLALVFMAWI